MYFKNKKIWYSYSNDFFYCFGNISCYIFPEKFGIDVNGKSHNPQGLQDVDIGE